MSHFGRWFVGISVLLVILIFTIFVMPIVYRLKNRPVISRQHSHQRGTDDSAILRDIAVDSESAQQANSLGDANARAIQEGGTTKHTSEDDSILLQLVEGNATSRLSPDGGLAKSKPKLEEKLGIEKLTKISYPVISEIPETAHNGASFVALPTTTTTTSKTATRRKHRKFKFKTTTATVITNVLAETSDFAKFVPEKIFKFPETASTESTRISNQTFIKATTSDDDTNRYLALDGLEVNEKPKVKEKLEKIDEKVGVSVRPKSPEVFEKQELELSGKNVGGTAQQMGKYDNLRKTSHQNHNNTEKPEAGEILKNSASYTGTSEDKTLKPKIIYVKTAGRITFLSHKTVSTPSTLTATPTLTTANPELTKSTAISELPIRTLIPESPKSNLVNVVDGEYNDRTIGIDKVEKILKPLNSPTAATMITRKAEAIKIPKITARIFEKTGKKDHKDWPKGEILRTSSNLASSDFWTELAAPALSTTPKPLLLTTTNTPSLSSSTATTTTRPITATETWPLQITPESETISPLKIISEEDTETEADAEEESDEDDEEYEDILFFRHPVTTTTKKVTPVPHPHRHQQHHLHHEPEQFDAQSPVIVTALFDIGRGKWPKYTRTYEQYMSYLSHLLKLRNRLVIYTDVRGAEFVRSKRSAYNTEIFEMSMRDLPLYRYREEMEAIIREEQKNWRFDPKTRDHPEANSADYDIIVNSKPYFLYNATQSSRFRSLDSTFAWVDAGYGHGRPGIIPENCHWRPQLRRDLITVVKMTPAHDKVSRYSITHLYRADWTVVSGGFIAGDSYTINRFYRFYHKTFLELLDSGKIDDDQTVLTMMLKNYGSLFNPVHGNGDWYAAFRLFPCR